MEIQLFSIFQNRGGVIFPENIHSCEAVLSQGSLNLTGISLIKMFNFTLLFIQLVILSIYVIVMGIIKCEKVFAGIFIFSSLFKIQMKVYSHRT